VITSLGTINKGSGYRSVSGPTYLKTSSSVACDVTVTHECTATVLYSGLQHRDGMDQDFSGTDRP